MAFEYKVVGAPTKGVKAKGVKTAEARFALAVEQAINALAVEGWEYVRTDVLPSEERQGLTGSVTNWRNLMVFRRALVVEEPDTPHMPDRVEPVLSAAPAAALVASAGSGDAESASDLKAPNDPDYEEGTEETRPA